MRGQGKNEIMERGSVMIGFTLLRVNEVCEPPIAFIIPIPICVGTLHTWQICIIVSRTMY